MAIFEQKPHRRVPRAQTRAARRAVLRLPRPLVLLLLTLGLPGVAPEVLSHAAAAEDRSPSLESPSSAGTVSAIDAFESEAAELQGALDELHKAALQRQVDPPVAASHPRLAPLLWSLLLGSILAGAVAFRKRLNRTAIDFKDCLIERFRPSAVPPDVAPDILATTPAEAPAQARTTEPVEATAPAEEESLPEVLAELRTGLLDRVGTSSLNADAPERDLCAAFLAKTPKLLQELRKLMHEVSRSSDKAVRRKILTDLKFEFCVLKRDAHFSELLAVRQLAAALEGLLKEMVSHDENVTPSTLRTLAAAVDLLARICVPGLRADILTVPPIRLLAVDDDPVSRTAVSLALKKTFPAPDLAADGEAALALAAQRAYDAVFLDVQMPGMNGFEVCTRIHNTAPNRSTPVVFVTCQSDFNARAQSSLNGGTDLIGKPFLIFEITVKALTLTLEGRLQGRRTADSEYEVASLTQAGRVDAAGAPQVVKSPPEPGRDTPTAPSPERLVAGQGQDPSLIRPPAFAVPSPGIEPAGATRPPVSTPAPAALSSPDRSLPAASGERSPTDLDRRPMTCVPTQLGSLRDLIQEILQTTDEKVRQELLANFYHCLRALNPQLDPAKEHPALRLNAALEALLKKLFENPLHCTLSTLRTASNAVDLLIDLCAPGVKPDLATHPPIRLLAVDDDPIALRPITRALKMTFAESESVDSGKVALALARERAFDVIFMDIEMPDTDGYTTCQRIHATELNRATPVVFVTWHTDCKVRAKAFISGGTDFIAKPFLTAEITTKALTLALRGRLQRSKPPQDFAAPPPTPPTPALMPDRSGGIGLKSRKRQPRAAAMGR